MRPDRTRQRGLTLIELMIAGRNCGSAVEMIENLYN